MLAIKGIYDGNRIKFLNTPPKNKKYKVIVTFVEELVNNTESAVRDFASETDSFSFWEDEREDIYQDFLKQ